MYGMHMTCSASFVFVRLVYAGSSGGVLMGTDIQRNSDTNTTPQLPADFWEQLEVQQACREQHFGRLLKAYRELQDPVIKQSELAEMLSLTQGQISRIERGTKKNITFWIQ
ncbi:MAG: helix-turn-helix domain-containing protein [Actinophytocola sp.]|nr:helix-turn-helix domain-containing protein [Actinophytocola sp.]